MRKILDNYALHLMMREIFAKYAQLACHLHVAGYLLVIK